MKHKGLWSLVAIVAILTIYATYDYKKTESEAVQKVEQAKLLTLNKDQISEIEIRRGESRFLAKRGPDGWRIEEPLKDWADNEGIEIYISSTVGENALDVVTEGDKIDWALYGLDKPLGQITFRSTSGESTSFDVSEKKNFEQNIFIRRNRENRVLVGAASWMARLNKGPTEFRDRRLLRHKIASIEKADFKFPKSQLTIELKDGRWILSNQPDKKLDQNKVRELLQTINETVVSDFIIEGREPNALEKKKYFLDKPAVVMDLKLGDKSWRGIIGQTPNRLLFAWTSEPLFVTKLDVGTLEKLFNATTDALLEKPKDSAKSVQPDVKAPALPVKQETK